MAGARVGWVVVAGPGVAVRAGVGVIEAAVAVGLGSGVGVGWAFKVTMSGVDSWVLRKLSKTRRRSR